MHSPEVQNLVHGVGTEIANAPKCAATVECHGRYATRAMQTTCMHRSYLEFCEDFRLRFTWHEFCFGALRMPKPCQFEGRVSLCGTSRIAHLPFAARSAERGVVQRFSVQRHLEV